MGKRKSTRLSKQVRATQRKRDEPIYGVEVPEALHEAIENARDTLGKADSVLRCLKISLEFGADDPVKGPYYPDIAEIACNLVRQAFNGLDSVNLSSAVMKHQTSQGPISDE
jgi:hypothetical protein